MPTKARPTPEQAKAVHDGYLAGKSTYLLGGELGRSASWVADVLRQLRIPRRRSGYPPPPMQDTVTYDAYHWRVHKARGKAHGCSVCGTTEDRRYEWANLTGRYEHTEDYASMCVPCHRKYDHQRRVAARNDQE